MIRHTVMYSVKEENKEANVEAVLKAVRNLKEKAAFPVSAGKDMLERQPIPHGPSFGNVTMNIEFPDLETVKAFGQDPMHMELIRAIGPFIRSTVIMDYEVEA